MKIMFKATGTAPDYYHIDGEKITAYKNSKSETYDLSVFPEGGQFQGVDPLVESQPIRHIERVDGELSVILCQNVIAGQYPGRRAHWRDSEWIDAVNYDSNTCYVNPTGMAGVEDYVIVQADGIATGERGWTVRKDEKNG